MKTIESFKSTIPRIRGGLFVAFMGIGGGHLQIVAFARVNN